MPVSPRARIASMPVDWSLEQLNGLDIAVVGISPDKPEALAKFRADHELNFPLLSIPTILHRES